MSENQTRQPQYKILVTHPNVPIEALELLCSRGEVIMCENLPSVREEILCKARGVDAILWATHDALNAEVLDIVGPQLKAISLMSAGYDYADAEEFKRRKIPLGKMALVHANAVADLNIGLMIAAARRFQEGRQKIENSTWETHHLDWMLGQEIAKSTVGFFGFGGVGQATARHLSGFEIERILYRARHKISDDLEAKYNAKWVELDELLRESDFIFIAAPLTNETKGVFDAGAFNKMKKTAVLINAARGGIVNMDDLYDALKCNQIFAAGIDVMVPEPLPRDDKLLTLSNLVVIPHLGSATRKTRTAMAVAAATNILLALDGKQMLSTIED